jgi:hypothetical protein
MGNPAAVRAKKRAKRREAHEKRLKIGRYAPPREAKPKEPSKG